MVGVAQSVERATFGEEVPGLIPAGWVDVSIMWPAETEVMVSPFCLVCSSTKICQTLCLGACRRYSLVVDEDVKKPNKKTKPFTDTLNHHTIVSLAGWASVASWSLKSAPCGWLGETMTWRGLTFRLCTKMEMVSIVKTRKTRKALLLWWYDKNTVSPEITSHCGLGLQKFPINQLLGFKISYGCNLAPYSWSTGLCESQSKTIMNWSQTMPSLDRLFALWISVECHLFYR